MAAASLKTAGINFNISPEMVNTDNDYVGGGYEVPSAEANRALKIFAEYEGIFLDPVYTAKAAAAMLAYIEQGRVEKGSELLFWHTGGTNALFAEKKILGDLL